MTIRETLAAAITLCVVISMPTWTNGQDADKQSEQFDDTPLLFSPVDSLQTRLPGSPPNGVAFFFPTDAYKTPLHQHPIADCVSPLRTMKLLQREAKTSGGLTPMLLHRTLLQSHSRIAWQNEIRTALIGVPISWLNKYRHIDGPDDPIRTADAELHRQAITNLEELKADPRLQKDLARGLAIRGRFLYGLGVFDLALLDLQRSLQWDSAQIVLEWKSDCLNEIGNLASEQAKLANQTDTERDESSAEQPVGDTKGAKKGKLLRKAGKIAEAFHSTVSYAASDLENPSAMLEVCELCFEKDFLEAFLNSASGDSDHKRRAQLQTIHVARIRLVLDASTRLNLLGEASGHRYRVDALSDLGLLEFALADTTAIVQKADATISDWKNHALALSLNDQPVEAVKATKHCHELDPDDPTTAGTLANQYAIIGDHESCIQWTGKALAILAEEPATANQRAQLLDVRSYSRMQIANNQFGDKRKKCVANALADLKQARQLVDPADTPLAFKIDAALRVLELNSKDFVPPPSLD